MTEPQVPTRRATSGELLLTLSDISHLFNAPKVDPLSQSVPEVLGISGIEHLLSTLQLNRKMQRARTLAIELPPDKAASALPDQVATALHRLTRTRIDSLRHELRLTYRYGWRATGFALVILAVCISLSSFFASDVAAPLRQIFRETLEYGFEIIGWVILWHPIDVLVFSPMGLRVRIHALQTLASAKVVIRPATIAA